MQTRREIEARVERIRAAHRSWEERQRQAQAEQEAKEKAAQEKLQQELAEAEAARAREEISRRSSSIAEESEKQRAVVRDSFVSLAFHPTLYAYNDRVLRSCHVLRFQHLLV